MQNLNRIEVIGNLTKDPELKFTPTNKAVTSLTVATNRSYKDQSNNWVDSPAEYHDIVIWGPLGERCNQVLHKGERIFVSGRLQTRSWEGQDGNKRYKTEIIADSVFGPDLVNKNMGSAGDGLTTAPATESPAPTASKKKAPAPTEDEINIDDIPF